MKSLVFIIISNNKMKYYRTVAIAALLGAVSVNAIGLKEYP